MQLFISEDLHLPVSQHVPSQSALPLYPSLTTSELLPSCLLSPPHHMSPTTVSMQPRVIPCLPPDHECPFHYQKSPPRIASLPLAPARSSPHVKGSKDLLQNIDDQNSPSHSVSNEVNLRAVSPFTYSSGPDPLQFTVRLPKIVQPEMPSKKFQCKNNSSKNLAKPTRRHWSSVDRLGEVVGDNSRDHFTWSLQTGAMVESVELGEVDVEEEEEVEPFLYHFNNDQIRFNSYFADFNREKFKLDKSIHCTSDPIVLPTHFLLQHNNSNLPQPSTTARGLTNGHSSSPTQILNGKTNHCPSDSPLLPTHPLLQLHLSSELHDCNAGSDDLSSHGSSPAALLEGKKELCSTKVGKLNKSRWHPLCLAGTHPVICVAFPTEGSIDY